MAFPLFQSFARMINGLPAHAVCNAVELECQMIANDLAHHFDEPHYEVFSIESFRFFLQATKDGRRLSAIYYLPGEHFDFYRKIVERLIAARELSSDALEHFDGMFLTSNNFKSRILSLRTYLDLSH